jgi:hypothetical protein
LGLTWQNLSLASTVPVIGAERSIPEFHSTTGRVARRLFYLFFVSNAV